jgi:hypothetical protein
MMLRLLQRVSLLSSLTSLLAVGCSDGGTGGTGTSAGTGGNDATTSTGATTDGATSGTGTGTGPGTGTSGAGGSGGGTGSSGTGGAGGSGPLIGFVPGAGVADPVTAIGAFSTWMNNGTGVQVVTDYGYPSLSSTTRMTQLGGSPTVAQRSGPLTASSNAMPLVWSTALVPSGSNYDAVIAGTHDALFTTEATNMKKYGFSNVIWRLGWECDGHSFDWAVYYGAKNDADVATRAGKFAKAFQHVVGLIKAVDPTARFEYNSGRAQNPIPNTSPTKYFNVNDPAASYPGDAYVDFIGTDNYGGDYHSYNYATDMKGSDDQIWKESLDPLSFMKSFATSRNKPFVVSEWGMMIRADGHGTNDSAYFMQHMLPWLNANTFYHTYFNAEDTAKPTATVKDFAAAGSTSLTLTSTLNIFGTSPNDPVGFLRLGTGNNVREIDYTSRNTTTNVLSGIPASGHGSIPAGGLAAGTPITRAIQNMCQLAVGKSEGDIEGGDQGFHDNPHLPLAAAAYRAGIK